MDITEFLLARIDEEYRRIFGNEPPTAPILKDMAQLYKDHPDFKKLR